VHREAGRRNAERRRSHPLPANLSAVKQRLADPDFALGVIRAQLALVLLGGGALGAFECGLGAVI